MSKSVYFFGDGRADGSASMTSLLGGKGANLAEMIHIGIPVPPGLTITTEVCNTFFTSGGVTAAIRDEVMASLREVERVVGRKLGDAEKPLLVSVRSGARASMPGMMDTILNLGINDTIAEGLAKETENPRFAYDAYRRFVSMYADVVLEVPRHDLDELLDKARREIAESRGMSLRSMNAEELKQRIPDSELPEAALRRLVSEGKAVVKAHTGKDFPDDPLEQLWGAVSAVFHSWNNDRAKTYRKMRGIPDEWGTACTVQAMVFGNLGDTSATGVAFTRDPRTGERRFFGEWLPNAQGEDVVAGIRTPWGVTDRDGGEKSLEKRMPAVFAELTRIYEGLEKHYRDMLDIEFTVQDQKLYLLQCRVGGRSGRAQVRTAVEMAREGLITKHEALLRVTPSKLDELLHPTIDQTAPKKLLAKGLPAGPGAATGEIVFTADEAEKRAAAGKTVILVRRETSPEDIHGMKAAAGILTARGGMTSHAAVVARVIGKCCVAGCTGAGIDYEKQTMTILVPNESGAPGENIVLRQGDVITLWVDDKAGHIYLGEVPMVQAATSPEYDELMGWADEVRTLRIRANADKDVEARTARSFGAEGIGLCRTEHMFFEPSRIHVMRQMIVADTVEERTAALDKLLPFQREDFAALFRAMAGLPVTIRLLDPPLHEFLPTDDVQFGELAALTGLTTDVLRRRASERHETNPMLGHRGVRLAVTYPEIYAMQVRAILEAACDVAKEGLSVIPEIMIPLAVTRAELDLCKRIVDRVAEQVFAAKGATIPFRYGSMIELPRAALAAGSLAETAEFFSFGTNDLTQTTWGLSRDDAGRFFPAYQDTGVVATDPFQSLDIEGVGELVRIATERGRKARPGMKLGVCGEHGGDPASIAFFHAIGMDYVSCAPFRVPIARLAAAQAVLRAKATAGSGQLRGSAGAAGGSGFGGGAGVGGGSGGGGGNPGEMCGNGVREAAEKCDGADLDDVNCASLLGTGVQGTLGCRADCTFDASACTICGNGTIDAGEECEDGPSVKEGRCVGCRLACPDGGKAFGGHCYAVYKSFRGWDDARKECEKKQAHLVTIDSPTENEHVWLLVGKQQCNPMGYWLGLSDLASENTFVWVTAEDVVFTAWGANEPNDFFNEDCASFGVSDGRWSDVGCGVIRGFVCELDDPLKP